MLRRSGFNTRTNYISANSNLVIWPKVWYKTFTVNIFGFLVLNLSDLNTRSCISLRSVVVKQMPRISLVFYIINLSFRPSFYHSVHHSIIFNMFGLLNVFVWTDGREQAGHHWERERNRIWTRVSTSAFYHSIILSFYHSYQSFCQFIINLSIVL